MQSRLSGSEHTDLSRRSMLSGLAFTGLGGLTGCLGEGGGDRGTADGDEDGSGDTNSGDGSGGCPQGSSLNPYDVADTAFVVVPSFPDNWEKNVESYGDATLEVSFGYPGSYADQDTFYRDNISVLQLNSPVEKDVDRPMVEQEGYEEADPIVIDGTECFVVANRSGSTGFFQFTAPGPRDNFYTTKIGINSERESCFEEMRSVGRSVLDSLTPNTETTI